MTIFSSKIKAVSCLVLLCFFISVSAKNKTMHSAQKARVASRLLYGGFSKKRIVETAASHNGSVLFKRQSTTPATIHLIAIRIEFVADSTPTTTGTGLFGGAGAGFDLPEIRYYDDNVYKYDDLPHDSAYVAEQLEYAKYYFQTVS